MSREVSTLPNKNNQNLLHIAATGPNIEILKYFITKDININARDKDYFTPLTIASINKNNEAILYLFANGSEPFTFDDVFDFPPHLEKQFRNLTLLGVDTYNQEQQIRKSRRSILDPASDFYKRCINGKTPEDLKDYILKKEE
ncbi:MAG: ankyrin repeat domain-containing protein [Planctomycetaceae bacterium]|jgi:ankyrin repeat protein|nr:ankyrin repeat domain-containing protein [Planctomycetaceae bacterium]